MSSPKLHSIVGYRTSLRNGIHIIDEDIIIYPAGNVYVLHNIKENTQIFLTDKKLSNATQANFDLETKILALTIPGKRRDFIALFDLNTTERLGSLFCDEMLSKIFICLSFSPDGTHVIGQTGPPDWKMIYWDWIKNEVICAYDPLNLKKEAEVYQLSFHPKDPNQVCSVGKKFLRSYRISGGNFKQYIYQKHEEVDTLYLCHAWFLKTKIAVGTNEGNILVLENNEQVHCIEITDEYAQNPEKGGMLRRKDVDRILTEAKPINFLLLINKLLLALWDQKVVIVLEIKDDGIKNVPLATIELPSEEVQVIENSDDKILSLVASPRERFIGISTEKQQIYSFSLFDADWEYCFRHNFQHLLHPNHWNSIVDMDVCVQKPHLIVSTPDFIHIWNYKTQNLELRKCINQGLSSIAFHPSGNYIVAGCLDKLRYYAVYLNDIKVLKEYPIRASNKCAFSVGGHRFAATTGYVINIYSSINFELITRLRGHFGEVTSILWSDNENYLVSCGMDGAVYEWNIVTSERVQDIVVPTCKHTDMAIIENGKIVLALASDATIKKIKESHVVFTTTCNVMMTSCVSTYSEKKLYLGTQEGNVRVENLPLGSHLKGEDNIGHLGPVKKMKLSYDGSYLMTVGEDSTLCFWKVKPDMIRKQPFIKSTFIVENELQEKIKQIEEQKKHIENLRVSKNYQLKEKEISYAKQMEELVNQHKSEIETLTNTIDEQNAKLMEVKGKHQAEIDYMTEFYNTKLQKQKEEYKQKLMIEYRRLEKAETQAQKQYDEQQKELEFKTRQYKVELETVRVEYESKLAACNHELEEMHTHLKNKESVWEQYIEEMEHDADEEILDVKTKYESQLRKQKQTILILKTERSILRTKIVSQKSEIEHTQSRIKESEHTIEKLKETIQNLNEQLKIFHAEINNRDKNLEIKVKRIGELQDRINYLEKYNFVLKESLDEAKEKVGPWEKEKTLQQEKIKKLEKEVSESTAESNEIKSKVKELEKKLSIFEQRRKKEKKKKPELEDDVKLCFEREKKHLKDMITSLETKLKLKEISHQKLLMKAKKENTFLMDKIQQLQNTEKKN